MDYEHFFLSQLPIIEKVIGHVCRRNHLRDADAQEFASEAKLHLIQGDYEVLRRFQQRSSFQTYLTVVVQRLFLNYRNRLWGRWRPSAEACRLGPIAVQLERLIVRDGWSFEEAQEQLRTNHRVQHTCEGLAQLWAQLSPAGAARRFVPEAAAADVASDAPGPDANVLRAERNFIENRVRLALDRARRSLTAEERLLLKMRIDDGFKISEIAVTLHLKRKPLYRTFERLLSGLRDALTADGVSADDVRVLLEAPESEAADRTLDEPQTVAAAVVPFPDRKQEGRRG